MPFGELPYRMGLETKKKIDKHFSKPPSKRYKSIDSGHITSGFISDYEAVFPSLKSQVIYDAENTRRHHFRIFGIEADFGYPINWHLDPKTQNSWPIAFWGDINYRDGKALGGIKFAWELNRLHHIPRLAIAFSLTGNSAYKDEIFSQLESWLESNPYPRGINWISGIELGIRVVNIVYMLKFLGDEYVTPKQHDLILELISTHGRHLYRYPSKHSSCANHCIAEALGLFTAGLFFPSIDGADKWKIFGKNVLEREITRQIYTDGSSFEHSIPYLQFVVDNYLVYYILCQECGEPCGELVEERLKSSFEFISNMIDQNGYFPLIGDDDDGYLLRLWFMRHNNFISLLNTGAVLFEMPDWILEHGEFDHKTFFILRAGSNLKWNQLKKHKENSRKKSTYFKNAALGTIRDYEKHRILFIGNSGPLGLKPMAGHGHSDALSFWLSVNGHPIFIDPGAYLYHSGGRWRNYFRSTAAHNTIRVDCLDQAEQIADFMFAEFYNVRNVNWIEKKDRISCGAEHDGYLRLPDPVIHRRDVTFLKQEHVFDIVDKVTCRGEHDIELMFHLHPDVRVKPNGNNTFNLYVDTCHVILRVDKQLDRSIFSGSENPLMGWYSSSFNRLEKTISLVFRRKIYGDSVFRSEVRVL